MARQRSNTRDDFDRVKDTANKLKSENRRLRKENSALRKQLNRINEADFDRQIEIEEESAESIKEIPQKTDKVMCPKCKVDEISIIPAGKFLIKVCSCGYRRRTEAKE